MHSSFSLQHLRRPGNLARSLAFVALVFTAAVQAQEAGHWHELDDTYVECLLCKHSADAQLTDIAGCAGPTWLATFADDVIVTAPITGVVSPFNARGPPAHS
ncbi:hypothetical protein F0M18_15050 [Pseudohalioglobus sediminis]|uniref:Uncharacterized protein n=1 Tax=Pseudohalioglobus sediminis TaxID=2606449 RepID=A0A5B0WRJ1_9GAMM|nr:hypothetical protein [Pseudohalioglobus sediminis]KAA1189664.1 hypothetical protein F0M18_15050 [Pseudohalioglobus sediminis]